MKLAVSLMMVSIEQMVLVNTDMMVLDNIIMVKMVTTITRDPRPNTMLEYLGNIMEVPLLDIILALPNNTILNLLSSINTILVLTSRAAMMGTDTKMP